MTLTCSQCTTPLSRRVHQRAEKGLPITGMCQPCYYASIRVDRRCCECGKTIQRVGAVRCQPCNNRRMAQDADREARRIDHARQARVEAHARHVAANREIAARRMAWLPDEHRAEYFRRMKRVGAPEARAFVLSRMTPFQRQMARVLSGARVVEKLVLPTHGYDRTLGGVSAGMLA